MISEFMLAILNKVRKNYPCALLLDAPPAIYDSIDVPYIVSPGDGEVLITHMISNSSQCDFTAHIYLGNHIPNANRQTDISENILDVLKKAEEIKPDLIICGASAYSRLIDFKKFKEIADKVGAKLMADIAHIAGAIATGLHPSPVRYADIITSTTHKTLRGARGGIIMTNDEEIAKKVDR